MQELDQGEEAVFIVYGNCGRKKSGSFGSGSPGSYKAQECSEEDLGCDCADNSPIGGNAPTLVNDYYCCSDTVRSLSAKDDWRGKMRKFKSRFPKVLSN